MYSAHFSGTYTKIKITHILEMFTHKIVWFWKENFWSQLQKLLGSRNLGVNSGFPHPIDVIFDSVTLKEPQIMDYIFINSVNTDWEPTKDWHSTKARFYLDVNCTFSKYLLCQLGPELCDLGRAASGFILYSCPSLLSGVIICLL